MPDSGLGLSHFQEKVLKTFQVVLFSLGSGWPTPDLYEGSPEMGEPLVRILQPQTRRKVG